MFHDATLLLGTTDEACVFFRRKFVHVKSGVAVQVYIFGKLAECSAVSINNFAALMSQVEDVLTIDNLHICSGGTSMKDFV